MPSAVTVTFPMKLDLWLAVNGRAASTGTSFAAVVDKALREYFGSNVTVPISTNTGQPVDSGVKA